MGIFDALIGGKVASPGFFAALQTYQNDKSEDNLTALWLQLLKSKFLVATTPEGAKLLSKMKNVREALGTTVQTTMGSKGELMLAVFTSGDNLALFAAKETPRATLTGDVVHALALVKSLPGMIIDPGTEGATILKCWQHTLYIEKQSDATKLNSIAAKLMKATSYEDAEPVLKAAIVAAQKNPGPQHPFTAELNVELAVSMQARKKYSEAEWVYKRALSIYESAASHAIEAAATAESLAYLYISDKRKPLAVPFLEKALQTYQNVPGAKPDNINKILNTLADICIEDGRLDDAESRYRQAALLLEERNHPELPSVLNKMALLCEQQEKLTDAVTHYKRAISACEANKRHKQEDHVFAYKQAIAILEKEGPASEALDLLKKSIAYYESIGDPHSRAEAEAKFKEIDEARRAKPVVHKPYDRKQSPTKRPELPTHDFSAYRKNSDETQYMRQPEEEVEEPRQLNPEEEALEKMRSFLNSVDLTALPEPEEKQAEATNQPEQNAVSEEANEEAANEQVELSLAQMRDFLSNIKDAPAPQAPAQAKPEPQEPAEPPLLSIPPSNPLPPPAPSVLGGKKVEISDEKFSNAFDSILANAGAKVPSDERYDKPISERLKEQAEAAAQSESTAAPAVSDTASGIDSAFDALLATQAANASEAKDREADQQNGSATGLFEDETAKKLNAAFDSLLGPDKVSDDRYDTPISERKKASPPADNRFDVPISERLKQAAPQGSPQTTPGSTAEVSTHQGSTTADPTEQDIADAFAKMLASTDEPAGETSAAATAQPAATGHATATGHAAPSDDIFSEASAGKSRSASAEPPAGTCSTFEEETEKDIADAFSKLLGDKEVKDDRYDRPISERLGKPSETGISTAASIEAPTPATSQPHMDAFSRLLSECDGEDAPTPKPSSAIPPSNVPPSTIAPPTTSTPAPGIPVGHSPGVPLTPNTPGVPLKPAAPGTPLKPAAPGVSLTPQIPTVTKPAAGATTSGAEEEPTTVESWMDRGLKALELKKLDEAIKCFDRATVLKPEFVDAWYHKGHCLFQKSRYEDAIYCFNQGLNLSASHVQILQAKGDCLIKLGRNEQGLALYDKVLGLKPDLIEVILKKAKILFNQHRYSDAIALYDQVLASTPENEEAIKGRRIAQARICE